MIAWFTTLSAANKLFSVVATVAAALTFLAVPGPLNIDTSFSFFAEEQWTASRVYEISPAVLQALDAGDESVALYANQLQRLRQAAAGDDVSLNYDQQTRADGWTVVTVSGVGQGYDRLNDLFFDGQADIGLAERGVGQPEVSILWSNLDPAPLSSAGGANTIKMTARQFVSSNADRLSLNSDIATWNNPFEVSANLVTLTTLPAGSMATAAVAGGSNGAAGPSQVGPGLVDVIRNGGFELPWPQQDGVAAEWTGFSNGRGHFSWYEELWPEAVHSGERAQLMEIFEVEANALDRVIAIHQTVDVVPNAEYDLSLSALMRTDADQGLRNNFEFEMHWGIDPFGEGDYNNVTDWIRMPLTEQFRLGSQAVYPEANTRLFYEPITGTVRTADSNRITLFIRGLKKFPNNVEVNFDVDEVSLIGPAPGTTPAQTQAGQGGESNLPSTGAVISPGASLGTAILGGLVVVVIGTAAAASLLSFRRRDV